MLEGIVRYIEKGQGLHDAIAATGHYLREEDGIWIAGGPSGPTYVQAIIDTYEPEPPPNQRKIPKTDFLMRLPPQKLAALLSLSESDPIVAALKLVLLDPTLTIVDLDSGYLSQALDYLVTTYPENFMSADKAAWIA